MKTTTPTTYPGTRTCTTEDVDGWIATTRLQAKKIMKKRQPFILVKKMTGPEDVHTMKEAAAVVTTEGGPSCHAAIVCNMLGKPCLTGVFTLNVETALFHLFATIRGENLIIERPTQ